MPGSTMIVTVAVADQRDGAADMLPIALLAGVARLEYVNGRGAGMREIFLCTVAIRPPSRPP